MPRLILPLAALALSGCTGGKDSADSPAPAPPISAYLSAYCIRSSVALIVGS